MRISLVTGATRGIGRQTVKRLVEEGHRVYLGARDAAQGAAVAQSIGAQAIQLDVTDDESVRNAAERIADEEGRLDVLVNNAGINGGPMVHPAEQTLEQMIAVFETNVLGCVRVTNAFVALLQRSDAPTIVNVSSGMGSLRITNDESRLEYTLQGLAYPSSKAALNMITSQYAKALTWARVNAADPGSTQTDMNQGRGRHTLEEGSEVCVRLALLPKGGVTGRFHDVDGQVDW